MRSLNKVMLIGNLGKDPEVQHLESGVTLAKFPLATSESYKDKSGKVVEQTEWHNVVIWRRMAEVAEQYLKKGSKIYLEGKIRTRSWDDNDGNKKYMTEVVADTFLMLDKKGENESGYETSTSSTSSKTSNAEVASGPNEEVMDDLPF